MINGTLQCIGTNQHLKAKYGEGYILEIRHRPASLAAVQKFVRDTFPSAREHDSVVGRVSYTMPGEAGLLGHVFSQLERSKAALGIEDYAFNQPTLEGVFISFARKQEETN